MKAISHYFNSEKSLVGIKRQLDKQKTILERLHTLLPSPMKEHCVAVIPKNNELILLVDSPAWASRLRYLSSQLKQRLHKESLGVRHIRVKVALPHHRTIHRKQIRRINPLSPANAKIIGSVANCQDDPALKMALLRLSKHGSDQ